MTMAKVRRALIPHLKAEVQERYNHNLLKSMTWTNIYIQSRPFPDPSLFPYFHMLLWKNYFVHCHSSDKTQALNPIKRRQGARGINQQGQQCNDGSLRAELRQKCALATAAARRSTFVSIDKLIQISSPKIPRILTAREKEGGSSTPGKLAARRYLCRCHGSSGCACQGDISVNMSPQSSIAVGTHTRGGEPVISDTGQRLKPNSWCWAWGMQRSNKPTGQLERETCKLHHEGTVCFAAPF